MYKVYNKSGKIVGVKSKLLLPSEDMIVEDNIAEGISVQALVRIGTLHIEKIAEEKPVVAEKPVKVEKPVSEVVEESPKSEDVEAVAQPKKRGRKPKAEVTAE